MKCSVFIASSLDNYIAREDNSLTWLETGSSIEVDMGFNDFISDIDFIIMGRNTMTIINQMGLTLEQWPYGDIPIIVLSTTLTNLPGLFRDKGEVYRGDLKELIKKLSKRGYKNLYIDGGSTIRSFLNEGLITDITISIAPVILGKGIPLFTGLDKEITLSKVKCRSYPNDFIQVNYKVE